MNAPEETLGQEQVPTLGHLTHASIWLLGEAIFKTLKAIHNEQESINTKLGEIMAQVQVDDTVLTGASTALETLAGVVENLVKAVDDFLASPAAQAIPAGDTAGLTTALGDAQTAGTDATNAQTALGNAFPPAAPAAPVDPNAPADPNAPTS